MTTSHAVEFARLAKRGRRTSVSVARRAERPILTLESTAQLLRQDTRLSRSSTKAAHVSKKAHNFVGDLGKWLDQCATSFVDKAERYVPTGEKIPPKEEIDYGHYPASQADRHAGADLRFARDRILRAASWFSMRFAIEPERRIATTVPGSARQKRMSQPTIEYS